MTGTTKWFNVQKGFGFITADDGSEVFVHHSAIVAKHFKLLNPGDRVEFDIHRGTRGRRADKVIVIGHIATTQTQPAVQRRD